MIWRWAERLAFGAGLILIGFGVWQLLPQRSGDVWQNASYTTNEATTTVVLDKVPLPRANYLGWATLLLGFLTLGSSNYFKWREDQRAERAEGREIEAHRRKFARKPDKGA